MVLEELVTVKEALRHPLWMFAIGGIVSILSFLVAFFIFPTSAGTFATFLITIAMTPFMVNLVTYEEAHEEEQIKQHRKMNFLARHKQILEIYSSFFSGIIVILSIAFLLL